MALHKKNPEMHNNNCTSTEELKCLKVGHVSNGLLQYLNCKLIMMDCSGGTEPLVSNCLNVDGAGTGNGINL